MMLDLAQDFQVIAPDQRGCGLSGKPLADTTPAPWPATWSR